jgi:6-phosphogluconolactonase
MLADERWVPLEHEDRNERMVRSLLLQGAAADADFLSLIPTPDDSVANVAGLSTLLASLPSFDVVLLGMGEDAHTASLFPCAAEIKEGLTTRDGALMTRPKSAPHQRVSMSKHRLQNTRHGVVHIVGDTKKRVYETASGSGDERQFPICAFSAHPAFQCWWAV